GGCGQGLADLAGALDETLRDRTDGAVLQCQNARPPGCTANLIGSGRRPRRIPLLVVASNRAPLSVCPKFPLELRDVAAHEDWSLALSANLKGSEGRDAAEPAGHNVCGQTADP